MLPPMLQRLHRTAEGTLNPLRLGSGQNWLCKCQGICVTSHWVQVGINDRHGNSISKIGTTEERIVGRKGNNGNEAR